MDNQVMKDVFICHASEDKEIVIKTLIDAFDKVNITYWYDEAEIQWGDSITQKVNDGLSMSYYIIVVLSLAFLSKGKNWPQREFNAISNIEASFGEVKMLPLLVGDENEIKIILKKIPLMNDKSYLVWDGDTNKIIKALQTRLSKFIQSKNIPIDNDLKTIEFNVKLGNILDIKADIIALKFANYFYGADEAVANTINIDQTEIRETLQTTGSYKLYTSVKRIKTKNVLFINVGSLNDFNYGEIRQFAFDVFRIIAIEAPNTEHIAMTMHGVGYGLDEAEAFRSQLAGYIDAIEKFMYPNSLKQITIVEHNSERVQRLKSIISIAVPGYSITIPNKVNIRNQTQIIERSSFTLNVGNESQNKKHVFVALPDKKKMEDIYYYGIQIPVNANGYLCERPDLKPFTARTKMRIDTSSIVIADLTGADPDVYLNVGYALGKERKILILIQNKEKIPFDLQDLPYIVYNKNRIHDLEKILTEELKKF